MIKSRFDTRTWHEIVGDLIIERTNFGDAVHLEIQYRGTARPIILLKFTTMDPDKSEFPSQEEITDWLPETPFYTLIDDSTGKAIDGEFQKGYSDWRSYINDAHGLGPEIQRICKTGGRYFTYEER